MYQELAIALVGQESRITDYTKGIPSIPPHIISRVMMELGYPIITYEDLHLKEQDVIELFIYPAMQHYFAYTPNVYKTSQRINSNVSFEIPFPTDDTFGVLQARISLGAGNNLSTPTKINPFRFYQYRSMQGNARGNVYDNPYYTRDVSLYEAIANRSFISLTKAGNMEVDVNKRTLKGFSNVPGELIVSWARCSDKWEDIRFEHENEVIDLAKAYALRYVGMLRGQLDSNTGVTVNSDMFLSRADKLEEEVIEKWHTKSKVIVIR